MMATFGSAGGCLGGGDAQLENLATQLAPCRWWSKGYRNKQTKKGTREATGWLNRKRQAFLSRPSRYH